jgi:hypothetical protein
LKTRDHLEYLGVYGRIILKWILTIYAGMAKDEDTNRAVANMVINLRGFFEYVWYVTPFNQDDMY